MQIFQDGQKIFLKNEGNKAWEELFCGNERKS